MHSIPIREYGTTFSNRIQNFFVLVTYEETLLRELTNIVQFYSDSPTKHMFI